MTQALSLARPCPPMADRSWFETARPRLAPGEPGNTGPTTRIGHREGEIYSRECDDAVFPAATGQDCSPSGGFQCSELGHVAVEQYRGDVPSGRCTARSKSRSRPKRAAERCRPDASSTHHGLGRCCREEACRCREWRGAGHELSCPERTWIVPGPSPGAMNAGLR